MEQDDTLDRRDFGRLVAAGFGGAALGGSATNALAQEPATPDAPRPPSLSALILARIVTECPGEQWDETMLQEVLNDVRGDLARGRQLSDFPLKNGDDPATVFTAYRSGASA